MQKEMSGKIQQIQQKETLEFITFTKTVAAGKNNPAYRLRFSHSAISYLRMC
jgi:hypothetical protein